jgi:hypothetical protein
MINNSLPDKVEYRQQFTIGRQFPYDILLYERVDKTLNLIAGHNAKKLVIIELKYVRMGWVNKKDSNSYKLGPSMIYKTFEQHMADADLPARVAAAKVTFPEAKCHAIFIMAVHGGRYRVGRYSE